MLVLKKYNPYMEEYTLIPNELLRNTDISLDVIGLICRLLSNKDGFIFNKISLMKELHIGEDKFSRILNEAKDSGYLINIIQTNKKSGKFHMNGWLVSAFPQSKTDILNYLNKDSGKYWYQAKN